MPQRHPASQAVTGVPARPGPRGRCRPHGTRAAGQHREETDVPSVHDWIKAYGRAWEDRDDDAVGELFAPGAIYRSHPFREPLRGRDAIRTYWRQATGSLTGISLTFGRPITDGARGGRMVGDPAQRPGNGDPLRCADLAVRPGRPLRGTPRILAPRRGPRHPRARRLGTVAHRGTGTPRAGRSVRVVRFWFTPSGVTPRTGTR